MGGGGAEGAGRPTVEVGRSAREPVAAVEP
jgi:hypothetical protein